MWSGFHNFLSPGTTRDYQTNNILPLDDNDPDLQELFAITDPDEIARRLNDGLNKLAASLTVKTKVKRSKLDKNINNQELRKARQTIREQSKVANSTKDIEENCLLKYMNNV